MADIDNNFPACAPPSASAVSAYGDALLPGRCPPKPDWAKPVFPNGDVVFWAPKGEVWAGKVDVVLPNGLLPKAEVDWPKPGLDENVKDGDEVAPKAEVVGVPKAEIVEFPKAGAVVEAPKPEVVEVPKAPPVPNNGELVNAVPVLPKPGVAVEPKAGAVLGAPKAGALFAEPKAGVVLVAPKA